MRMDRAAGAWGPLGSALPRKRDAAGVHLAGLGAAVDLGSVAVVAVHVHPVVGHVDRVGVDPSVAVVAVVRARDPPLERLAAPDGVVGRPPAARPTRRCLRSRRSRCRRHRTPRGPWGRCSGRRRCSRTGRVRRRCRRRTDRGSDRTGCTLRGRQATAAGGSRTGSRTAWAPRRGGGRLSGSLQRLCLAAAGPRGDRRCAGCADRARRVSGCGCRGRHVRIAINQR